MAQQRIKALVLTSDRPRHRYFASVVANHFDVPVALVEEKKNYYVSQLSESEVMRRHFEANSDFEAEWFTLPILHQAPPLKKVYDINQSACIEWALEQEVEVICLYGTGILGDAWLQAFPKRIINLHLGLSPHYRGSATLFWPFVHRELHFLGTTIHLATAKIDAGSILARVRPTLHVGEDYYVITNNLIRNSIDIFPIVVNRYLDGDLVPIEQSKDIGRFCRKADFCDSALVAALNYIGDGLTENELVVIASQVKQLFLATDILVP